jgi:hypothetical protein
MTVGDVPPPPQLVSGAAEWCVADGPAQDVRTAAAAMRLRANLFVMPDGTAAVRLRFPEISQRRRGCA